jgi:hypothetical protein
MASLLSLAIFKALKDRYSDLPIVTMPGMLPRDVNAGRRARPKPSPYDDWTRWNDYGSVCFCKET